MGKYKDVPLFYGGPCQVKFFESVDQQMRYGIAFHDRIFCGCCGANLSINTIIEKAKQCGLTADEAIVELSWNDIEQSIANS